MRYRGSQRLHACSAVFADSAVSGLPMRIHDRLAGGRGSGPTSGEEQEKEQGDKEQIAAPKSTGWNYRIA